MAKKYLNLSDRTERLIDNLKCRTEADTVEEVIRKAVQIYNLVGTAIEQGHKVVIGAEPISLMEFHPIPADKPLRDGKKPSELAKPEPLLAEPTSSDGVG